MKHLLSLSINASRRFHRKMPIESVSEGKQKEEEVSAIVYQSDNKNL